jgi:hypothetical protein
MYIDATIFIAHEKYVFSAYRLIFFGGSVLSFIGFLLIFFFFHEIDVEEEPDTAVQS